MLDDFGSQQITDWSLEKLYQLTSYRHDRRMRTVIAGHYEIWDPTDDNKPDQELPVDFANQWVYLIGDDRSQDTRRRLLLEHQWLSILSRLGDQQTVTVVALDAPDYRIRGN